MNIIFDLDKTLIHSISEDQFTDMKDISEFCILKLKDISYLTYKRRYYDILLDYCFNNFKVGFWSAGTPSYILPIIKNIVSKENFKKITIILGRTKYTKKYTIYQNYLTKKKYKINNYNDNIVKSLDLLYENKDFKRIFNKKNTLLVDDYSHNISINKLNSIHIPAFCSNKQDNILLDLLLWLIKNKNKKNIQRCSKDYYTYDIESYNCRDKKNYNKYGLGEYIKYNNKDGVIININNNNTYNIISYDTFKIINNIKYSNIHY